MEKSKEELEKNNYEIKILKIRKKIKKKSISYIKTFYG